MNKGQKETNLIELKHLSELPNADYFVFVGEINDAMEFISHKLMIKPSIVYKLQNSISTMFYFPVNGGMENV